MSTVMPEPHEPAPAAVPDAAAAPLAAAAPAPAAPVSPDAPLPPLADERRLLAELEVAVAAIDAELSTLDAPR